MTYCNESYWRKAPEMTNTRQYFSQLLKNYLRLQHHHHRHRCKTVLIFIGVLLIDIQNVSGGICWSSISNSKCKELLSQGVTREECCASNAAAATAYSEEDLDSGSLFFWRVLGGGVHCRPCRESCAQVQCEEGKKCVVRRGRPRCVCSPECKTPRGGSNGPVCGTDGRSYRSLCRLKKHACKKASHELTVAYHGYCQSSCTRVHCGQGRSCLLDQNLSPHCVKCARKCPQSSLGGILEQKQSLQPMASRPVCGADGNTYKSACHLRLAACRAGRAIPVAYKGHCKQNADCTTIRCREGQTCLTEIKTNRPRCVTCMYRCPSAQRKHENSEKRQRFRGDDPGYPSVLCATNNMTYPSWCHIIKDACVTGFVLETKHAGPCNIHDTSIYDEENITSASYGVDLMDEVSKFSENLTRNN
ncbi:follistatin-A isoform X1 [Cotesia glomerata]|uniref:follistatin-A isoform X1 n=1 Tax=Cotesia glomerata TaxID=32391 RepID=UPI001D029276|nr:follistatin-A isoform X1 [Cotesia glomerata]